MGCPGSVFVGDQLTFSICTHDVATGDRADASASPTYTIYEDDTATPVASGTLAKHNSITGLYLKKISTTGLFAAGKHYNIDISATVAGVTGGIAYGVRAEDPARLLKLDWAGITGEAARSLLNALRHIRNKWSFSGTTKTVFKEDDATPAWTSVVTVDSNAVPVTGDDPA